MEELDQELAPLEQEFIDDTNSAKGVGKNKQRFPVLTSKLLQLAISQDLLSYNSKDSIIRDPNIHTILQIRFDSESPRLIQALKLCNPPLEYKDLKVEEYEDRYDKKQKPLVNLIAYLHYITDKYKLLSEVLKKRNSLKLKDSRTKKILTSKDIRYQLQKSVMSTFVDQQSIETSTLLTEVPMLGQSVQTQSQPKFLKLNGTKASKEESSFQRGDSFLGAGSVMSQEDRRNKFNQKQEEEEKHFKRFFDLAIKQVNDKDNFYSELPTTNARIELKRETYLQKIQKKVHESNRRVDRVQNENSVRREEVILAYPEKVQQIEEDIQKHIDKRNRIVNERMTSISEQKKHLEQLEEERELRRLYYQQEEEQFINEVIVRLETKQSHLSEYLTKKQALQEQQRKAFQENLDKKQERVRQLLNKFENQTMKDYVERQSTRQVPIIQQNKLQLMKYEDRLLKEKRDLSLKHLKQLRKVEKRQIEMEQKQMDMLDNQLDRKQDRIDSVLKRHSSLVEIRKIKVIKKNQIRQQQSKVNYLNQLLINKKRQDQVVQSHLEMSLHNQFKRQEMQELEKYKMEQQQEQGQKRYELLHSQKF